MQCSSVLYRLANLVTAEHLGPKNVLRKRSFCFGAFELGLAYSEGEIIIFSDLLSVVNWQIFVDDYQNRCMEKFQKRLEYVRSKHFPNYIHDINFALLFLNFSRLQGC